jgi:tyrosyl-tRNA synthetase
MESKGMGFIEVMKERGMLAQVTHEDELRDYLAAGVRTAYAGFDPTADSLHVGHLLPVLALRRWQRAGHRVIVLLGGGTAMIGDPTGKSEMRQMMDAAQIDARAELFKKQLARFLFALESHHGQQRGLAETTRVSPFPARHRHALFCQSDACC